jgi:manganese transport protein
MPHNLYLHSSIVQTRMVADTLAAKRDAIKFATIDSTIALMLALLVNASILILAAATFHKAGERGVADLADAQRLLTPLLGSAAAATAFGIALLCCGLNSTVTATLSGQIVMEGFINVRLPAWARRLATRSLAIIPAAIAIALYGASGTGKLLILSQVILSMQLPFAIVPLVMFTADKRKMGALVAPRWVTVLAVVVAAVVIALNAKIIFDLLVTG